VDTTTHSPGYFYYFDTVHLRYTKRVTHIRHRLCVSGSCSSTTHPPLVSSPINYTSTTFSSYLLTTHLSQPINHYRLIVNKRLLTINHCRSIANRQLLAVHRRWPLVNQRRSPINQQLRSSPSSSLYDRRTNYLFFTSTVCSPLLVNQLWWPINQ